VPGIPPKSAIIEKEEKSRKRHGAKPCLFSFLAVTH
jgi:hypothetical protein